MGSPTQPFWLIDFKPEHRVDMALAVLQRIHERLVAIIDNLRNAVGQEAAKVFLISLTNAEPVEFEHKVAICDDF